jgi:DNA-binding GntR family transcriptional regulator
MHSETVVSLSELEHVIDVLRRRIATRQIAPGAKLQEFALTEEFGVSRLRIREALLALQQRGLVQREPNRSAVVVKLDLRQVMEIYDVREAVEGLCVRLATEKQRPESWQDWVDIFDGPMNRYWKSGDLEAYINEIDRFRRRVMRDAENELAREILQGIHDKTQAIINRVIMLPGRIEKGLKELRPVIAAMRAGRAREAERLRRINIRSQREFIRRYPTFVL